MTATQKRADRQAAPSAARSAGSLTFAARRSLLTLARAQPVHLGSSLSVVDILVAAYLEMGLSRDNVDSADRDRLILSKGHAVWALYAVLSELGVLELGPDRSRPGHPADRTPGVDAATGALGHGLSIGAGLALAARLDGHARRTFVVLGDGELDEGTVWEAAMFAAHQRLGRLTAIVDVNGMQQEGRTCDTLDLAPLDQKWRAFGWQVRAVDGHDLDQLGSCLQAPAADGDRPTVVLASTVKGKGVAFMEHDPRWHVRRLDPDQFAAAVSALADAAQAPRA